MIPPPRHASALHAGTVAVVLTSAGLLGGLYGALPRLDVGPDRPTPPRGVAAEALFRAAPDLSVAPWGVLRRGAGLGAEEGAIARRFRLAGTLFGFGVGSAEAPQAILDDKLLVAQRLVRRGDEVLPGVRLTQVRVDAVELEGPHGREELRLQRTLGQRGDYSANRDGPEAAAADGTADDGRFGGGAVFPGRWEFRREALLDYYAELRNAPERLLAVFDSMEPLYRDDDPATRQILGYRLNVRGEAPLFAAMGIAPGDIVRSVNSVAMTNRRLAENFIRAFVEGEEDTFVIEVERGGSTRQQVYIIR